MTTPVPETKTTTKKKFACDGGGPADGHPRVWLTVPNGQDWVECPYCDARYVYAPAHSEA